MPNKELEKLKGVLELLQNDTVTPKELEQFLLLVLDTIKLTKDNFDATSQERLDVINDILSKITEEHSAVLNQIDDKSSQLFADMEEKIGELRQLAHDVISSKPLDGMDGADGKDADPEEVVELVLQRLPEVKEFTLTSDDVKEKLSELEEESREEVFTLLGSKRLTSIEDTIETRFADALNRIRLTSGNVKDIIAGSNITVSEDGNGNYTINSTGGGTLDGSGTTNELAYWIDSDTLGALTVATYPSLTELTYVKGVTSAIQTQLGTKITASSSDSLINKTIDGDNNTISNLDIGLEVDWAAAANVSDASAFESGDKLLIFEAGVGLRKIDYDDLPSGGTPGGSDTQVQYNNGGSFGGSANLTWDSNDSLLQIGDGSNVNTVYSLGFSIDKTATPSFIGMNYGMQLYFDGGGAMLQLGNGSDSADGFYISSENGGELAYLDTSDLSAARTYTFPDQSGTIALTSDIGSGGIVRSIVTTSGSLTLGATASTDYVYYVAGAHTLSMPSPNTNRYTVKNLHSAAITIDTAGAENIEGASSISLEPNDSVDIISDGTNWYIH